MKIYWLLMLFSVYSTVSGGYINDATADYAAVGGGQNNRANGAWGSIGGGELNTVSATYNHSSILGGQGNTINGSCSAILGGCNNTVNHNFAAVVGCNITTALDCAFHANQLVAPDTQLYFGATSGLLQYFPVTAALVAAGLPAGSCIVLM